MFRGYYPPGRGNEGDYGPPPPPFRIRRTNFRFSNFRINRWIGLGVALIILFVILDTTKGLYVNWLWFQGAGYQGVYEKILRTQILLFLGGGGLFALFFGANVFFAGRLALATPARGLGDEEADSLRRLYQVGLIAAVLFLAVVFGTIAAGQWDVVLRYMNRTSFGVEDPQFHRDVGFFVFTLPALRFAFGWLLGALVITTLATAGLYFFRYQVVGPDVEASKQSRPHLCLLLFLAVALFVWRYWLHQFELDFSTNGPVLGATYTDIHARLPFIYVGMAFAVITGVSLLYSAVRGNVGVPIAFMIVWVVVIVVGAGAYPQTVQRLSVQPNELEKERQYIQRNIDMTRKAFALDTISERPFPAAPEVTPQEIADNRATIDNIRLLDVRPLKQTYAQIQTIRPLYEFIDVDIDRYTIDGQQRAVMLSARELSASRLPAEAQSWVNRRLQFTHGYGAVMSPVNAVGPEGLPELLLRDIPVMGKPAITQPEIYYGEEPEHYVAVNTKAKEFDYPIGDGSVQNVFQAGGGVRLGSIFRRLVLAWQFNDLNLAISGSVTSESRLLFHRNIQDRINTLAPFLTLDKDPYLVIADGRQYWMQDAYTTTDRFPYSTRGIGGYNYIRNSVKIVVDAYDGTTTLYLADPTDPMIQTYARMFPKMFTPLDKMPASLREHVRYPEDLYLAQISQYRLYHIKDPGQLYNKEDVWSIPTETSGASGGEHPVDPYYVIMRLPDETNEQFVLILPLTPARRSNTIAWIAAGSDGPNYGKLTAFRFPTDSLVYGPRQIESRIDQDPAISAQFSLWNQSGSRVTRGNLLMIPIGRANLFVEPIYLQSESSQLPEMKRVVVVNGNHIAMEPSLAQSLAVIFDQATPTLPNATPQTPAVTSPGTSTTPTANPTPRASTTPATASPTPQAPSSNATVADLARQADAAYQRAQDALKTGDFATYGQEMQRVQDLIKQIVTRTQ